MTRTSPPEPAVSLALPLHPRAVPLARHHAATEAARWAPQSLAADAALITTELVTNAIQHAPANSSATITLVLQARRGILRVEVTGPGAGALPVMTTMPGPRATHGRGRAIVSALAAATGSRRDAGRLAVWAEIPLTSTARERPA